MILPGATNIAFIEDAERRADAEAVFEALTRAWPNRSPKRDAVGIHGIAFFGRDVKRKYYPTPRDEEADYPYGSAPLGTYCGQSGGTTVLVHNRGSAAGALYAAGNAYHS